MYVYQQEYQYKVCSSPTLSGLLDEMLGVCSGMRLATCQFPEQMLSCSMHY